MSVKTINNKKYFVNDDEFNLIFYNEYNNLKIIDKLGYFETIISFIKKLSELHLHFSMPINLYFCNTTHGGFIPLNCLKTIFNHIYLQADECDVENIIKNIDNLNEENVKIISVHDDFNFNNFFDKDIFLEIIYDENLDYSYNNYSIIISKINFSDEKYTKYHWINSELYVYVYNKYNNEFKEIFKYFLYDENIINYDNLNHLCIMVKNAGPQFEDMLNKNMNKFDRWTILDTGSTDETIEIINKVLVGKKCGKLYCEPFINFKDSRNRLLELAKKDYENNECKYITVLDDTYVIDGNLTDFLKTIRGDQYANSFSLYISSDDCFYGSNRIIRSDSGLKYVHKIHEVITDSNNINVIIPNNVAKIIDRKFDYMEKRTIERKELDLKLLFEELEEDPNNPRTYYYLGQTYNILNKYEEAYTYFLKRMQFINCGFIQERYDATFEAGRIANFKLNKSWEECLKLYEKAIQIDDSRPDAFYFIGIHYYIENNFKLAYKYFKIGFELGFPSHCQFSLKPTLSYHFLPKFLTRTCYNVNPDINERFLVGFNASKFFLENNNANSDDYMEILSWNNIYSKLIEYNGHKNPIVREKPLLCFVADGGFNKWSGSSINNIGVGGSETYIIEMARYIQQQGEYDVFVFCNCLDEEVFENVQYKRLSLYSEFIYTNYVKHVIVSRYSEYLPLTYDGWSENVYLVVHDLTPSGVVIPMNNKLKNIFCLTEWHVSYMKNMYPLLENLLVPFYYGIDKKFLFNNLSEKIPNSFIYSSFPNRGLLVLIQMWPRIYNLNNTVSLNIYCDLENEWVNNVAPEQIKEINHLLEKYSLENEYCYNIKCHGWVSKLTLSNAWKTADIWFYPCIFMETFCLTALEAAASCTVAISNDLAALQNTVGNRGIVIPGNVTTLEWQEKALEKISIILNNNGNLKNNLIEKNYSWASNLSWSSQATILMQKYMSINKLEYKGMYNWTNDIPVGSKNDFLNVINYFNSTHKLLRLDSIKILEIGTYTGTSLINIVKNIPKSIGYGLDKWENYNENELLENISNLQVFNSFKHNVNIENLSDRIIPIKGSSNEVLMRMFRSGESFDFIYVDGSHLLLDCYMDLVLSWQLLSVGGILAIDDYLYKNDTILDSPFEAVNHFMEVYKSEYNLLLKNYRVFLEKL